MIFKSLLSAFCLPIFLVFMVFHLQAQRPDYLIKDSLISKLDGEQDLFYYFETDDKSKQPLVVELHSWSNSSSSQKEILAQEVKSKGWNYMLPNFRGPNRTVKTCCSEFVISDIDQAIDWAVENMNVDKKRIYVVGVSGGGYATMSMYMKSRHEIAVFSAWCGISDLVAWYYESEERNNRYSSEILACTGSGSVLDTMKAIARSPLYWKTPVKKRKGAFLQLYAGIHDGHTGSVPVSHSALFYNKIADDMGRAKGKDLVSEQELEAILNQSTALGRDKWISDRQIHLEKSHKRVSLIIFEGGHEILPHFAISNLK